MVASVALAPRLLYRIEEEVEAKAEEVFRHIYRVYPTVPSPFFNVAVSSGMADEKWSSEDWFEAVSYDAFELLDDLGSGVEVS